FGEIIKLLKQVNPDIKIYSVIIPKYIETERRDSNELSKHISYFNDIIEENKGKYGLIHLDFKKISDISENDLYYYDAGHLNMFGAQVLTDMLNKIIFRE
ncbi:MAG: SGNH/GDSL hydrolase family protein, partial [Oscillospiraceae bacterium]|nr:SGNH/GDSL hydrolase family protein [Oscillospiraceae bacterium]